MALQLQKMVQMHEYAWSSVSGIIDGLTPEERYDALSSLKGSWRDPKDSETWKSASTCVRAAEFEDRVACWSQ